MAQRQKQQESHWRPRCFSEQESKCYVAAKEGKHYAEMWEQPVKLRKVSLDLLNHPAGDPAELWGKWDLAEENPADSHKCMNLGLENGP